MSYSEVFPDWSIAARTAYAVGMLALFAIGHRVGRERTVNAGAFACLAAAFAWIGPMQYLHFADSLVVALALSFLLGYSCNRVLIGINRNATDGTEAR